jgi:hypothetical protein
MKSPLLSLCLVLCTFNSMTAQTPFVANYDEANVGSIPIPDVLTCADGSKITSGDDWVIKRRPEILRLFAEEVFGKTAGGALPGMRSVTQAEDKNALDGKATMRQVRIYFTDKEEPKVDVLLYLPNGRAHPAPVFVSLNFGGNQTVSTDPTILMPTGWFKDDKEGNVVNGKPTEKSRGSAERRWPVAEVIARGYGVATAYYGDLDPDFDDGFQNGVHPLFYKAGQNKPGAEEWGSLGVWAWGMSRMLDYLETLPEVDKAKFIALGHSRLGKAAMWAGAQDERFGMVISNNSGAGGAALAKRIFGETVGRINASFPHWFCGNYKKYSENEAALPVDSHQLIALVAPRPYYVASATEDNWADQKGEFLGAKLAEPVYALFGKKGLGVTEPPAPDTPIGESIGYHNRTGKHDILIYDWERYMDFADKHWGKAE